MSANHTERFSDRVRHYVNARPSYPLEVMDLLRGKLGLLPSHRIADIGSGTGIFTGQLLRNGNEIFAVEPNSAMRTVAEQMLAGHRNFHSIDGTAEDTTLSDASVDFVTAAQSFHWFDVELARREFKRILRPAGWIVLLWNDRRPDRPAFGVEYHRVVEKYNSDLEKINHQHVSKDDSQQLRQFFVNGFTSARFDNFQDLDWAGVTARLFSSSYMPAENDPRSAAMLAELKSAFSRQQRRGHVRIEYDTRVFFGQV